MNYRFTRIWGHASAIVGLGLIAVAFLLAASALFVGPEDPSVSRRRSVEPRLSSSFSSV